jgi:hypothetical protein
MHGFDTISMSVVRFRATASNRTQIFVSGRSTFKLIENTFKLIIADQSQLKWARDESCSVRSLSRVLARLNTGQSSYVLCRRRHVD